MINLINLNVRLLIGILIISFIAFSCECPVEKVLENETKIIINPESVKFFQVQIKGISTHRNSFFTFSAIDSSLIFQSMDQIYEMMLYNKKERTYMNLGKQLSPLPLYLKLKIDDYLSIVNILNSFESFDFKGGEDEKVDGLWYKYTFVLYNNKIETFENVNFFTDNQKVLFDKFINLSLVNNTDSLTDEYLRYFK